MYTITIIMNKKIVFVSSENHHALKVVAFNQGKTIQQLLDEILSEKLKEKKEIIRKLNQSVDKELGE